MKKAIITLAASFAATVQAHTLDFLPAGLAHEMLHIAPVVLPLVLAILIGKKYLTK